MAGRRVKHARHAGLYRVHRASCAADAGCACPEKWEATAWSKRDDKLIRKHFDTFTGAQRRRQDALVALRQGELPIVKPTGQTVRDDLDQLIAAMRDGSALDRSGRRYRPSTIRSYEERAGSTSRRSSVTCGSRRSAAATYRAS
jgi:hypothetical protein